MKALLLAVAVASLLSGCIVAPYGGGYDHDWHHHYHDPY